MDVFVSYSGKDIELIIKMCGILKEHGISYWAEYENEDSGDNSAEKTVSRISESKLLLVFVSKNANESKRVMNELNCASMCNKPILPVVIDDVELSPVFEYYMASANRLNYSQSGDFIEKFVGMMHSMVGSGDSLPEVEKAAKQNALNDETELKGKKKKRKIVISVVAGLLAVAIVMVAVWFNGNGALRSAVEQYSENFSVLEVPDENTDSTVKTTELNKETVFESKYNNAVALMEEGRLDEAYSAFQELGNYKDAADKMEYLKFKQQIKDAKVGDFITFGAYEQDNDTSNGKEAIEWLVLDVQNGKALVISRYGLDAKPYYIKFADVTWENCTLRDWLNNKFINSAFTAEERAMIPTVTVSADENPEYNTDPGNATQDKVFLLSVAEANKYFSSDDARICKPTDYAVANGAYKYGSSSWWRLRSPGEKQYTAASVDFDGVVDIYGDNVSIDSIAVRPALWINLES